MSVMYRAAIVLQSAMEQGTKKSPRVTFGASLRGQGDSNSYSDQSLTRADTAGAGGAKDHQDKFSGADSTDNLFVS